MITNQRLIEVKDYLLDPLTHVAEVLATDITNEEYSHHADAIKNFIRKIRDNVLETNELTTSINRLRPILNKLLYDPNCKFHKKVFHALQIMTYVSPLNDYDNESSNYNSIITLVTFTDNNVFYTQYPSKRMVLGFDILRVWKDKALTITSYDSRLISPYTKNLCA